MPLFRVRPLPDRLASRTRPAAEGRYTGKWRREVIDPYGGDFDGPGPGCSTLLRP